ncbi:MAG: DUF2630 family protein [Solirubrobacteraceae bacterium]
MLNIDRGGGTSMDDIKLHDHIEALVAEEDRLLHANEQDGLPAAEHQRLQDIHVELDRYWDLLRQRRARREAGLDPDGASMRPGATVENYEG